MARPMLVVCLGVLALGILGSALRAEEAVFPGPFALGATISQDDQKSPFVEATEREWSASFTLPEAGSIRARITMNTAQTAPVVVKVKDEAGTLRETFTLAPSDTARTVWTVPVLGPRIIIQLLDQGANPTRPLVAVDKLAGNTSDAAAVESAVGPDQLQPISTYKGHAANIVSDVQRSIGKLTFIRDDVGYDCTAFLVADDIAMTNEHCVADANVCSTAVLTLGYQYDQYGYLQSGENFRCIGVVDASHELDFALIALAGAPGVKYGKLRFAKTLLITTMPTLLVQHPGGDPKMISALDCSTMPDLVQGIASKTDYAHTCDTQGGSSGSPVLSYAGEVVALHHVGRSRVVPAFQNVNRAVAITDSFRKRLRDNGVN